VRANLKRYRAAVLKAACEGRLVPTEAELATKNTKNAKNAKIQSESFSASFAFSAAKKSAYESGEQLLTRILAERKVAAASRRANGGKRRDGAFTYKEPAAPDTANLPPLPEGWAWATIGQVAECLDNMRVPVNKKTRAKRQGSIPYYGANGRTGWIDDFLFDEPLILVVEDETFTGRTQPFCYKITGRSWVNNHAHILRPAAAVSIDFLNYSLAFYPFTQFTTGTTGRKKLTNKALLHAPYSLPPLAEQTRIVAEVERRLSVVDELEAVVTANLQRAARLRQAVLQKAFAGELV
jgi:type I restriction enzyme S subunit